jgi:monoamine oxidase
MLDALRRLASIHAEAAARGVDVERVTDERLAGRFDRRTMLKGFGAAAGVAALSQPRFLQAGPAPRIAIVGGGIAGLNAALTLQDAGYASTVYEASGRIGGRMHSNTTTWLNGQTSEWCGELIDSGHHTILQLAQRLGLSVVDEIQAQAQGSSDTLYFLGGYYDPKQAFSDFQPVHNVLQSQIQSAPFPTLYNAYTAAGQQLDNTSLHDWIEQFVPGGHSSPMGQYLDSAYNQEYGLDTHLQSSLNLVYLLGFQPKPGKMQIYGKSDERYHVVGGNDQIPKGIAGLLGSGSVQTGWRLTRIESSGSTYTLTFATAGRNQTVVADRVIMTIPFGVLRGLDYSNAGFDPLKVTAITELGYGTNSKLNLQFDARYWTQPGPWGIGDGNIYTDLFFQNTWESSRGIPGPTGVLVGFMGGSNGASFTKAASPYASADTDQAVVSYAKNFLSQLEIPWPGVTPHWNGRATLSTPWRDPNLLGSYSCWKPGQYTLFSGYEGARQGKCHFAGEHCSTNFQGFMEGGADEGARAANEILSDYKAGIFP